jgi:hypothetical protein
MRAVGSAKFLKTRFGMGYLLRSSLQQNANPDHIIQRVLKHVPEASVVSTAGTECAIRLPKHAVSAFPALFEYIDGHNFELGVLSYGIETTTLEEVFMRIVNEDTELLIADHKSANLLLGASGAERDSQRKITMAKDEKRFPLNDDDVKLLLVKGSQNSNDGWLRIQLQTQILVMKRFCQFFRSKGQWSMVVVVPLAMIVIAAIIMADIPVSILGSEPSVTDTSFFPLLPTPVAGLDEATVVSYANEAGVTNPIYVGSNYSDLYEFVYDNYVESTAAIAYASPYNATIMYNSTYATSYPGLISGVLQTALDDATGGKLQINVECQPLAPQVLGDQVRT